MRLTDAIKRPFALKEFLLGTVLSMVPVANFIVTGFALRNGANAANYDFKQKTFSDPFQLFLSGLGMLLISIVYLLPAIIVFIALFFQLGVIDETVVLTTGQWTLFIAGLVFLAFGYYLLPGAHIEFGVGSLKDGFWLSHIVAKAFTARYFLAWVVSFVYSSIAGLVGVGLSVLTAPTIVLPLVIFAMVTFITLVTTYTLIGEAMQE